MLNKESLDFAVWEDEYGLKFFGCRHRESGKEHGIVRSFKLGDAIIEASYKNGVRHGFCRSVWADEVAISLFKDDEEVAYFRFGRWFKETIRYGEMKELLEGLGPKDFAIAEGYDPEQAIEE